jgi:hypothetical protein
MRVRTVGQLIALAGAALLAFPATVAADCDSGAAGSWPSFRATSPYAATVIVGEVDAYLAVGRGGDATRVRFRVDEVLRGEAASFIEFRVPIEPPIPSCSVAPLRLDIGDHLALALDRASVLDPPAVAVARISEAVGPADSSGPERLTLADVRVIAAQPGSPWPLLALGGAILGAFLIRPSWHRPSRPGLVAAGA